MNRAFLLLCLLVLSSCNSNFNWKDELLMEIIEYDGIAEEIQPEYELDSGSSTIILTRPFSEKNGIRKTVFRHIRDGYLYFERHVYFKQDLVCYAHYVGVAPRVVQEQGQTPKSNDFLLFSKQYFFKQEGSGIRSSRQIISEKFKPKDSVLPALSSIIPEETVVYQEDYLKIKNYLRDVTSLDRIE